MTHHSVATRIVLRLGEAEAVQLESSRLEPEHLLIGLLKMTDLGSRPPDLSERDWQAVSAERDTLVAHLRRARVTPTIMRRRLRYLVKNGQPAPGPYTGSRSGGAESALRRAEQLASDGPVGLLDLLGGCLEQPSPLTDQLFGEFSVSRSALMPRQVSGAEDGASTARSRGAGSSEERDGSSAARPEESPLAAYGRDLTALAQAGELMPVIGRREDMKHLARVLGEKLRPNAVLVGEPGVGKTAIVEGLAQYAAGPDAHPAVRDYRFVEISAGALVANHGAVLFEVLAAAKKDPGLVLFIDEFHTLVRMGAADVLKPPLGRGELHLIGATTTDEYHKYLEPEEALCRRLFPVWVDETGRDETVEILRGVRASLEAHHGLTVPDEALAAAVDLTGRYMTEGHMPDKALTVLDQACSRHRLKTFTPGSAVSPALEVEDVGEVLAARTGIPADVILMKEDERWLVLEDVLGARVVGQGAAVTAVAQSMRQSRAGLRPRNQPPVFLFAGPSGTGKTELAKALSAALFLSEDRLIRVDMTDYREPHQVARLTGSPYGYVGSDETPSLLREVLRRPYSVVLLDEVEKAHPSVLQVFLPVFGEGYLTTAKGKKVDFSHAVFVMTSNLGSGSVGVGGGSGELGFRPDHVEAGAPREPRPDAGLKDRVLDAIQAHFTDEFLGRVRQNGRVVVFEPLTRESVFAILERQLADINRREGLADRGLDLVLDDSAKDFLMERGYSVRYGARDLQGAVQTWVANPLSRALLAGDFDRPGRLLCRSTGDALEFDYQPEGDQLRTVALAPRVDPLATR
jgi:ATP-dependent Clp protease ATP-binding subunit ClpC